MLLVRNTKIKTAFAIAAASLLAGCVPMPHQDTLSPAIDGTVRRNGQPVEGARLYVEGEKECTFQGEPLARSDANGIFRIPRRQARGYFVAMDISRGPAWRLCIAEGDRRYPGWYEDTLIHYRSISLDCNLASAPAASGICTSHADEEQGEPVPATPGPK